MPESTNAYDYFGGPSSLYGNPQAQRDAQYQAGERAKWGQKQQTDEFGWGDTRYYGGGRSFDAGPGQEYGQRMRELAQRRLAPLNMSIQGMPEAFGRSNESYEQQKAALDFMKRQAAGQGPSVATTAGQMGMDQATRAAMRGGPMLPASGGGLYNAANAGAAQRAQEVGAGQRGLMQGSENLRGQTLGERSQNLAHAARYKDIGLTSQQQDFDREMQLQKLALMGYGIDQSSANALADIQVGLAGDQFQRNQQLLGMGINAGAAGMAGVGSYFGGESGGGGKRGPKSGGYVGSGDWGSHEGYY